MKLKNGLVNRTVVMVVVVVLQIRRYRAVQFGRTPSQRRYAVSSPHVLLAIWPIILVTVVVVGVETVVIQDADADAAAAANATVVAAALVVAVATAVMVVAVTGHQRLLLTAVVVV